MADLIDRRAVLRYIERLNNCKANKRDSLEFLQKCVEHLPPAERKGEWIAASESLPRYDERVIVCILNEQIGRRRIGISRCYVQKEGFFSDVPFEYKVIAWMPLPEPYECGRRMESES